MWEGDLCIESSCIASCARAQIHLEVSKPRGIRFDADDSRVDGAYACPRAGSFEGADVDDHVGHALDALFWHRVDELGTDDECSFSCLVCSYFLVS